MKEITIHLSDGVVHVFRADYPDREVADIVARGCTVVADSGVKVIYPARAIVKVEVRDL